MSLLKKIAKWVLIIIIILIILIIARASFIYKSNEAKKEFTPIARELQNMNAQLICDNGDGGHGPDNLEPWYRAYYLVDLSPTLRDQIETIVGRQGFVLQSDTEYIKNLKGQGNEILDEKFNESSDYLIAHTAGKTFNVIISRNEPVALRCSDVQTYGKKQIPDPEKAIIDFDLQLPSNY